MIVYISGPMSGLPDYNRAAFEEADKCLKIHGHTPLNPAILPTNLSKRRYMPICLAMLEAADAIYMLAGSEKSAGAIVEYAYAKRQGIPILLQGT